VQVDHRLFPVNACGREPCCNALPLRTRSRPSDVKPLPVETDPRALPWRRALAVWALIALAETVHGVLRGLLLVPALGEMVAQRIGFAVGCGLVLAVAWMCSGWLAARTPAAQAKTGLLWMLLMLGLEIVVGLLRGMDAARIAAEFDPGQGGLMLYGLLLLAAAPWLAARLRRPR
jgi:hypothetical protein